MTRIADTFRSLDARGEGAYIPYVCAGDPSPEFTIRLVKTLFDSGADIIELGLPFSDPIADGPTIQAAMGRSLSAGLKVKDVFAIMSSIRASDPNRPIVLMTYFNPVMRMGVDEFCRRLATAGGDGILVVDVPPEESSELEDATKANSLDIIRLVAPSTQEERIDEILSKASGYVYAVSVSGVTGARDKLGSAGLELVSRVASRGVLPVALGFGISRPEHVRQAISAGASGVVEGSGLISVYSKNQGSEDSSLLAISEHAREMKAATVGATLKISSGH